MRLSSRSLKMYWPFSKSEMSMEMLSCCPLRVFFKTALPCISKTSSESVSGIYRCPQRGIHIRIPHCHGSRHRRSIGTHHSVRYARRFLFLLRPHFRLAALLLASIRPASSPKSSSIEPLTIPSPLSGVRTGGHYKSSEDHKSSPVADRSMYRSFPKILGVCGTSNSARTISSDSISIKTPPLSMPSFQDISESP